MREGRLHRVNLSIHGPLDEHQEEMGSLAIADHPFAGRFADALLDDTPMAEQSMLAGEQRFEELLIHQGDRP